MVYEIPTEGGKPYVASGLYGMRERERERERESERTVAFLCIKSVWVYYVFITLSMI